MVGTAYPLFIDTLAQLPRVVDGISPVRADDVNRLRDAVVAVEKELGINPSGTYATVRDRLDALTALIGIIPPDSGSGTSVLFDFISMGLEAPTDKTYNIVNNFPYDGYIYSVTSLCGAGTATANVKINGIPLGGGPNSVSTTEQTVLHSTSRAFTISDDLTAEFSSCSAITDAILTIIFIRFIELDSESINLDGYVRATSGPVQDTSIPVFDGITGKFIKGTGVTIDSLNNVLGPASLAVNTFTPMSTFQVNGSFASKVTTVTSPGTTLTTADNFILVDASSGNVQIILPTASTTIDFQYESLAFVSNGSNWFIY